MKRFFISLFVQYKDITLDGQPIATLPNKEMVIWMIGHMNTADGIYLMGDDDGVSFWRQEDGTVRMDMDDVKEENTAEFFAILKAVNAIREVLNMKEGK